MVNFIRRATEPQSRSPCVPCTETHIFILLISSYVVFNNWYGYKKMPHLQTYRVPLFNSMFYYRGATVAEAMLNSKPDCKTTPAANSTAQYMT
jgi:hypothetical protein